MRPPASREAVLDVSLIPTGQVDQIWLHLRDGFDKALRKTGHDMSVGDLWTEARSGRGFLFAAHDGERIAGASVWRFETWPSGEKFRCLALYGSGMKDWIGDMHNVVKLAAGKADLIAEGRPGWKRAGVFPKARVLRELYEEAAE